MSDLPYPTIVTTRRVVPNLQPVAEPYPYRIALIGEAPGEDEENHMVPFVGRSGEHLNRMLAQTGIDRNRCFVGNICQVRPPGNKIELFPWDGPEIQSGLKQLTYDLTVFNPNICILLGNTPLRAALGPGHKITAWRGSLFQGSILNSPFIGRKCVAAYHPASVLRNFEENPLLGMDLNRGRIEGNEGSLALPQRELLTNLDCGHLCYLMDSWPAGTPCSVDIEGGLPSTMANENVKKDAKQRRHLNWKCVALSARPTKAFAIPWWKFSELEHMMLLQSFARLMERQDVPKVLQNSLYDMFVLAYGYRILIRNVVEDTMLKGWEKYCELPKGLSTLASVWTREPHWKDDDMYGGTGEQLAIGCCKDVAVTLEVSNAIGNVLTGTPLQHYRTNMDMRNPALYMELRGIKYDQENVNKQIKETKEMGWLEGGIYQTPLLTVGNRLSELAKTEVRGPSGCLADKRLAKLMYEKLGYEPQFKKENGRLTDKYTTDIDALLKLRKKNPGDEFLNGVIRHRHLESRLETLSVRADPDGRVRCAYNVVGTDTGRFSCKTSPTGAGTNMTTITKKLRLNYVADPDFDFFQCDLAGADGWTVAAHCLRLGDPTMFEDYTFGLKPAQILELLYWLGQEINQLDRPSLKNACRAVDKDGWLYFASKRVQHGTNYMMGLPTLQTQVMKDSFKLSGEPIYLEHYVASQLQGLYYSRYKGLRTWHQWAEATLKSKGELTSASGHTRLFFGRRFGKDIHDTVKQFLADEPQQNTTWATNLAMLNLWNDPENRRPNGSLIIEPLHQVHDALCGQWPKTHRDWARQKVRSYFQNPLTIAGTTLTIPFEGAFGPSWGETPKAL